MLVKRCLSLCLLLLGVSLAQTRNEKEMRYFQNQTLRIICPEIPFSFQCDGETGHSTRLGGNVGDLFDGIQTTSMLGVRGVADETGNYNGILGNFQRNESDIYVVASPRDLEEEIPVCYGPTVGSIPHKILSTYDLIVNPQDFLTSLDVFSFNTWLLVLFTMFTVSSALKLSTGSNIFTAIWTIFRFMPEQALFEARTLKQKVLIFTFSLGSFVIFMGYFCNLLSTEIVTFDLSVLVDNLDDVIRLNKSPMFLAADPLLSLYRNAEKGSVYEKIWDKIKPRKDVLLFSSDAGQAAKHLSVRTPSLICFSAGLATFSAMLSKYSSHKHWISRKEIHSSLFHYYRRPNMSREAVEALDDWSYRQMESGLLYQIVILAAEGSRKQMEGEEDVLRYSLAQVVQDIPGYGAIEPITIHQLEQLFIIYSLFTLILGASTLLLEIVVYRINSYRERRRDREVKILPELQQMTRTTGHNELVMAGNDDPDAKIPKNSPIEKVSPKRLNARKVWEQKRFPKLKEQWKDFNVFKRQTTVQTISQCNDVV